MQEAGADVHITGSHLTNETEFTVVLSGICIAALAGVPPAAETGYRLAQPVTPETVYCPTLAGRRSKPRNLILCLARAGIEPTTSSTIGSEHTTTLSRQTKKKSSQIGQPWSLFLTLSKTVTKKGAKILLSM